MDSSYKMEFHMAQIAYWVIDTIPNGMRASITIGGKISRYGDIVKEAYRRVSPDVK